ncbi:MAG: Hpt domain-containing protein [Alphaproteobacteria bacterium]|nr:MAG: Hpt domain-containing protein [Alphaproteobacteria bacterium]
MTENGHTQPPFDRDLLFANFHGIEDMIPEIIECFLLAIPKLTLALESAVKSKNFEAIQISAHTMKGAVSNFYAEPSKKLALQLEKIGREKVIADADELFRLLCLELTKLTKALRDIAHDGALYE